jgi:hypothetical protein
MGDPKDRVEEEEGLIPAEARVLNVLAHEMCEDQRTPKRREKVVSEPEERDLEALSLKTNPHFERRRRWLSWFR